MKNRLAADLGKTIAVLVLIIILLMPILLGIMVFPWWRVNYKGENAIDKKSDDFCLTGTVELENGSLIAIHSKDDIVDYEDEQLNKTSSAFELIKWMLLIGLIITIVAMICIVITAKQKLPVSITMIISLIAFIILIIAPVYFILQVPKAYSTDLKENFEVDVDINFFIGSNSNNTTLPEEQTNFKHDIPDTWFPQISMILALIAPIINIQVVLGMRKNKRSYTYIPKNRGDLLYQQKQNHLPDGLIMQTPSPQPQPEISQPITPPPQIPKQPELAEFKAVIEGVVDEKRVQEIHQERLKILKDLKAESELDDMLDDYNSTITKIEEEEEQIERELSKIASKFDISDLVDSDSNEMDKNICPKCDGEMESKKGIFQCTECGSKFRQKDD